MITEELVQRINELARKKRNGGLTLAEQAEQKRLYKIYLASIREQVEIQLENIEIIPEDHVCDDTCHHHHHGQDCSHDHQHGPDGNHKKH
ncbi:MAG: DUF896 domain-containing protein [Syntrophomonadaceae bacterium]|nr:DUF896 domain-containing protein [Syntrophomonadaceae bacterium]